MLRTRCVPGTVLGAGTHSAEKRLEPWPHVASIPLSPDFPGLSPVQNGSPSLGKVGGWRGRAAGRLCEPPPRVSVSPSTTQSLTSGPTLILSTPVSVAAVHTLSFAERLYVSGLVPSEVSSPFAPRLFDSKNLSKKSSLNEWVGGLEKATNHRAGPLGAAAPPDLLSLGSEGALHALSVEAPGRVLRTDSPAPQLAAPLAGVDGFRLPFQLHSGQVLSPENLCAGEYMNGSMLELWEFQP